MHLLRNKVGDNFSEFKQNYISRNVRLIKPAQVFAWGCNTTGQLGLGDTNNRRAPAAIESLWAIPVAKLAAGDNHSAALTINGFLFTWGSNESGQLGLPSEAEQSAQVRIWQLSWSIAWTSIIGVHFICTLLVPDVGQSCHRMISECKTTLLVGYLLKCIGKVRI